MANTYSCGYFLHNFCSFFISLLGKMVPPIVVRMNANDRYVYIDIY